MDVPIPLNGAIQKGVRIYIVIASVSEAISISLRRLLRLRQLADPRKDTIFNFLDSPDLIV